MPPADVDQACDDLRDEMHTVQTGIAQFLGEGAELWGPLTAASDLVCAPAVLAYLVWQRQIIEAAAAAK